MKKESTKIVFYSIIILLLTLLFDRYCFLAKESYILRFFHVMSEFIYYGVSLFLMYDVSKRYLEKKSKQTFWNFLLSMMWAHFVSRGAQTIAYFISHLDVIPLGELVLYCIKRMVTFGYMYRPYVPWHMTLIEGMVFLKNVLFVCMNRLFKVWVCIVAYIENSNKYIKNKHYLFYGFVIIYCFYVLVLM